MDKTLLRHNEECYYILKLSRNFKCQKLLLATSKILIFHVIGNY